jgi:hypothetical protein
VSYRAQRHQGLGAAAGGLTVGKAASTDPILARASLDASSVLLAMAKVPADQRPAVLRRKLNDLQPGLGPEVARRLRANLRNRGQDQALFDAIRSVLADRVYDRGLQFLRNRAGTQFGWDTVLDTPLGLGQLAPNDRATGCTIAGGASAVSGPVSLIPVVGWIASPILGFGSQIASGAMDCTREQREAQARQAATQAAAAQAQLQAAQATAADAQAARRKMFVYGGGILGVTALLWLVLS